MEVRTEKYKWLKRTIAVVAVLIWFLLILKIFASGGGMSAQAPKCIFTTMIIFGLLTAAYKGIETLERKEN